MSQSSNKILKIYKSRRNILELLKTLDYNVSDYDEFSINEIDAMVSNDQLDMLITNSVNKKIYIKYLSNVKSIRKENLDTLIEDLYYKCKIEDENNKEGLWQELISLIHNMNKGGCFYNIKSF